MISEKAITVVKVTLLSGFLGGLWGAFLEVMTESTGNHLLPQLLNIVAMACIGLYAIVKMQGRIAKLEDDDKRLREDNRRLRAEVDALEIIARNSPAEWPEASENLPQHDVKSA